MEINNLSTTQHLLDTNTGYQLSKDVIARKNQDGTVIVMRLDESSLFYKIDGMAAQVWLSLNESKTPAQLVSEFSSLYPQNRDQISQDIPQFLSQLLNKKLITTN